MKFLVDAALPKSLSDWFGGLGHDSIHTLALPNGNSSTDSEIIALADAESRIIVTKDKDFRDSQIIRGKPGRLLLVTTGNIKNSHLLTLFEKNMPEIERLLNESSLIELNRDAVISHK